LALAVVLVCSVPGLAAAVPDVAVVKTAADENYVVQFQMPESMDEIDLENEKLRLVEADDSGSEVEYGNNYSDYSLDGCIPFRGPGKGKPCIFPFKFTRTNKTYHSCTYDTEMEPWCSTKVNSRGEHLTGNWGQCPDSCPILDQDPSFNTRGCTSQLGHECFFPFSLDGYSYRGCLGSIGGDPGWCYAKHKEDSARNVKDQCTPGCPKDLLLTHQNLSAGKILHTLLVTPQVNTRIKRHNRYSCNKMLEKKFQRERPENLPAVVRGAKSFYEATILACRNSDYCKGFEDSPSCQTHRVTKRFNVLKVGKSSNNPKSDCKIECDHP